MAAEKLGALSYLSSFEFSLLLWKQKPEKTLGFFWGASEADDLRIGLPRSFAGADRGRVPGRC